MKTVGLCIEFYNRNNYGTMLQALSTKNNVEKMGYSVRIIRYKKQYTVKYIFTQIPRIFDAYHLKGLQRKFRIHFANKHSKKFVEYRAKRAAAFELFRNHYFPSDSIDVFYGYPALKAGSTAYDSVLVGSDQLWLPQGVKTNFYNLAFVPDSTNKISYATSFGVSKIPHRYKKDYQRYLARINHLSVREESGRKIIKDLCEKKSFVACDPVLLTTRSEWDLMTSGHPIPGNIRPSQYLLCYFLGNDIAARQQAQKVAKELNIQLVSLIFLEDYLSMDETFGDMQPKGVGPEQFIQLIKNAAYVITDSFHGTAFSIIFGKQFLTTYRFKKGSWFSKNSRIDNILEKFGLMDRLYQEGDCTKKMLAPIDYDKVSIILSNWRDESLTFLQTALADS